MATLVQRDLDFWVTRLHARRSRLAEGTRLDELCRLRTVAELARTLGAESDVRSSQSLQRWLITEFSRELTELIECLPSTTSHLISWQAARLQLENIKLLARGLLTNTPLAQLQHFLIELPDTPLPCDLSALAATTTVEEFIALLPSGSLRESAQECLPHFTPRNRAFMLESALDCGYLTELLSRTLALDKESRVETLPLTYQEINIFLMMLVARGVLHHQLAPAEITPLFVGGTTIAAGYFDTMLKSQNLRTLATLARQYVLDVTPHEPDAATVEMLAWNRYWRLANLTFRRAHIGSGAVISYTALRRIEVANLITLSEGLRMVLDGATLRARLIPFKQEHYHA